MGEPVRIDDLARQMIRLAGLQPDIDIRVAYTGLRPGEKLTEELLYESEPVDRTSADGVLVANPQAANLMLISKSLDETVPYTQHWRLCKAGTTIVWPASYAKKMQLFGKKPGKEDPPKPSSPKRDPAPEPKEKKDKPKAAPAPTARRRNARARGRGRRRPTG